MTLHPLDFAIISQAIVSIAREMGAKLIRSAFSTIVREAQDCSAAILDRHGNLVAQAAGNPMQIGSMGTTLRACLALYPPETLTPDDFLVNNHPYHGAQHLQDIYFFTPVFFEGQLVAFCGSIAHHLDIGGGAPGLNVAATEIFQEGIQLPPARFSMSRDWHGGGFERLLAANVRVPDQMIGDCNAQFAGNAIGLQRLGHLCSQYGADAVMAAMEQIIDVTETRMRRAIEAIPDGVYVGEDALDDDGVGDTPIWIRTRLTVKGSTLEVDFTGTCDQVTMPINAPFASTVSAVMSCLVGVLLGDDVPFSEGGFRPVKVTAPLGSILNPRHPAPVRARQEPCYRAYCSVMKALSHAVPGRTIASGFDATVSTCFSRLADHRYRICLEVYGGGFGASDGMDGASGLAAPLSNSTNTPVEALDMEFDFFRIKAFELDSDSFGYGQFRGGLGLRRTYEVLEDAQFTIYADRFRVRPDGLRGGEAGGLSDCRIIRDGAVLPIDARKGLRVRKGDIVVVTTSGGAGYGDPRRRRARQLEEDAALGLRPMAGASAAA
ncbi:MAG: hydantoinase B/oxoprolinase family protein [Burkholderiaceae bacterium]